MHTLSRREGIICHIGAIKDGNNLIMETAAAVATATAEAVVIVAADTATRLF